MKRSQLLEAFGDSIMSKVTVNITTGGEIELTDDDPALPEAHLVEFHAQAEIKSLKFDADKGRGMVIMVIDRSSFVIDSVTAPPEEPATEPMIGADGESLIGDVVGMIVEELDSLQGPVPGEGFDALEDKPKRGKKAAAKHAETVEECPWPACTLPAEHGGQHEFPTEDPNE